jgi:hypothetical protein
MFRCRRAYNVRLSTGKNHCMNSSLTITTVALLVLTPVLVWRVYARLKTQMQRQRSILTRHYTGIFVFLAMILVPASEVLGKPMPLAALAVGTAAGIAYGIWGLKLTRFDETDEGYFFTPNARLGIVISMLFAARVLYIGFELYAGSTPTPPFTDSPLTMLVVGLTGAYFGTYSIGILRWRLKRQKTNLAG